MSIKKGRVAIVTGAGQGLGRAIAIGLANEGAFVVSQDINYETVQETVKIIKSTGKEAIAAGGDVAKTEDCENCVNLAVNTYGSLDILVNNAGIIRDALIHKMTDEEWESVLGVIISGTFKFTRAAVKIMKEKQYGRIINISSTGYVGDRGQANYAAAKAGVVALTRVTAAEYTWCGVTANCICPGPILTPMGLSSMKGKWLEFINSKHPMGHPGKPEDISYMVNALAAEEASYITAQTIAVDGGFGRIRI